jgi:hypothetical protein
MPIQATFVAVRLASGGAFEIATAGMPFCDRAFACMLFPRFSGFEIYEVWFR